MGKVPKTRGGHTIAEWGGLLRDHDVTIKRALEDGIPSNRVVKDNLMNSLQRVESSFYALLNVRGLRRCKNVLIHIRASD